jgi:hypothetical protein
MLQSLLHLFAYTRSSRVDLFHNILFRGCGVISFVSYIFQISTLTGLVVKALLY